MNDSRESPTKFWLDFIDLLLSLRQNNHQNKLTWKQNHFTIES